MNKDDILKLEKKLDAADYGYHTFGASDLSDAEYDDLKKLLASVDPTNKRLKQVGATVKAVSEWKKFDHNPLKMGSQKKVNLFDDLKKWSEKMPGEQWIVEHKLDGTSLKLIYVGGKLVTAATRGDGDQGEDITENARKMNGVQQFIPDNRRIVFRSEILLFKSKLHLVGGKNTRNSAAGTAKRLDGAGCTHLNVKTYGVMNWKELGLKTVQDCINLILSCGLDPVTNYGPLKTIADVEKVKIEYEKTKRTKLDWDIDGLIVQKNTLSDDDWDYPKFSMAYKFNAAEAVTKLIGVEWRDRGGRISPVAQLEPVDLMGTTISAATLNNIEHIKKLGVKIGDMVVISRRNDVIPCIERVSLAATKGIEIKPPTHDSDGFPIVHEKNALGEELVYLVSTNPNSSTKVVRSIVAWYKAHDAKGIAAETVSSIIEAGIANDLAEFYTVGLHGHIKLVDVEGFGTGKFRILNKATLLTSQTTILKFLDGMDIQGFGVTRFETILEQLNTRINLMQLLDICSNEKYIGSIPGFGENTAKSLHNILIEKMPLIEKMAKLVQVEDWTPVKATSTKINGLSFCFTGSMSNDRGTLEKAVKKHGGVVAGVSKTLDYLVTDDPNSGTGKNEKATSLGIKKITEKDFLKLINNQI